jgi:hypothetical protein
MAHAETLRNRLEQRYTNLTELKADLGSYVSLFYMNAQQDFKIRHLVANYRLVSVSPTGFSGSSSGSNFSGSDSEYPFNGSSPNKLTATELDNEDSSSDYDEDSEDDTSYTEEEDDDDDLESVPSPSSEFWLSQLCIANAYFIAGYLDESLAFVEATLNQKIGSKDESILFNANVLYIKILLKLHEVKCNDSDGATDHTESQVTRKLQISAKIQELEALLQTMKQASVNSWLTEAFTRTLDSLLVYVSYCVRTEGIDHKEELINGAENEHKTDTASSTNGKQGAVMFKCLALIKSAGQEYEKNNLSKAQELLLEMMTVALNIEKPSTVPSTDLNQTQQQHCSITENTEALNEFVLESQLEVVAQGDCFMNAIYASYLNNKACILQKQGKLNLSALYFMRSSKINPPKMIQQQY